MQLEQPFPWGIMDTTKWEIAFLLPTLSWAKLFIPLLGLPKVLGDRPEIWSNIYHEAMVDYQHRYDTKDWEIATLGGRSKLIQQVFGKAFQKLSEQEGEKTAIDYETWILLYFFDKNFALAMKAWSNLLRFTCHPNKKFELFPLPTALKSLLPNISEFVSYEHHKHIKESIYEVAPAPAEEQIPYEKLDRVYEAHVIEQIIGKTLPLKALQIISSNLKKQERAEFIEWMEAQSFLWCRTSYPDHLLPDLYLVNEMPTTALPLILSINH